MPPFQRKTLVLIGAQGVGRRSLKNRLIVMNPLRYGTTVPCKCGKDTERVVCFGCLICLFSSSYITASQTRGERRAELLFCDARRDGERHQREPVPGARRVRWQPLRYKNRLHPRGGGCRAYLHPGCEPSGQSKMPCEDLLFSKLCW